MGAVDIVVAVVLVLLVALLILAGKTSSDPEFAAKMPQWWVDALGASVAGTGEDKAVRATEEDKKGVDEAKKRLADDTNEGVDLAMKSEVAFDLLWKTALSNSIQRRLTQLRRMRDRYKEKSEDWNKMNDEVNLLKAEADSLALHLAKDMKQAPDVFLKKMFTSIVPVGYSWDAEKADQAARNPETFLKDPDMDYLFLEYTLQMY
eukprot:jgi/Mesvir1/5609/Mv15627-RA.1